MKAVYKWALPDEISPIGLVDGDDWDRLRFAGARVDWSDPVKLGLYPGVGELRDGLIDQAFWDVDIPGPPCVAEAAAALLQHVLGEDVQFIPASFNDTACFIMNPLRLVAADEATSVIIEEDDERHVLEVGFRPADLSGLYVFALAQESFSRLHFTDAFVALCDRLDLGGLTLLELVWSQADGPLRRPHTAFIVRQLGAVRDDLRQPEASDEDDFKDEAYAAPDEQPLDERAYEDYMSAAREGFASLPTTRTDPEETAVLIDRRVESLRASELDEETWVDVGSTLGALLGEQIVRRYGWSWVRLTFASQGRDEIVVVAPDRSVFVSPIGVLFERLTGNGSRVFSVFVACKDPSGVTGAAPNAYVPLG